MAGLTLAGAWRAARRLGFRRRRGQLRRHSPDPDYGAKLAAVAAARAEAAASGGRVAFLYQDELTYHRRPSVADDWSARGGPGRRADCGLRPDRARRVIGALDALTGRLFARQRARATAAALAGFFRALAAAYPGAERVYVALDNWPVHFHPAVLAALPARVVLLRLPTYAPWTNPIEKAWRKLRQEVRHLHDSADDWAGLQAAVQGWLDRHAGDCPGLLRYVGLKPD
jgi:transposase